MWQPIETAPKDGTRILLFKTDWTAAPIAKWEFIDGDDDLFGAWVFDDEYLMQGVAKGVLGYDEDIQEGNMPTLWAPLPI